MTAQFEALKKPLGEPFVVLAKKKKKNAFQNRYHVILNEKTVKE